MYFHFFFFFFNDTATTEIYTLSLHDALPISFEVAAARAEAALASAEAKLAQAKRNSARLKPLYERSEEHTSELQSRQYLVCRLLLEKKKKRVPTSRLHGHASAHDGLLESALC